MKPLLTRRRFRIFGWLCAFLLLAAVVAVYCCNQVIVSAAKGRLYASASAIPYNKTGLLLGTGKYSSGGAINPYYQYRINAAWALLRAGRIRYLIISGDNSRKDYNEPQQMKDDLVSLGADPASIYLDFAGFRTLDSVVRLKAIFGQTAVTIISQPFHNERAVYLAGRNGISAIAFNAQDVEGSRGWKVQWREKLARVKVFADAAFGKAPKYLGEKVVIP